MAKEIIKTTSPTPATLIEKFIEKSGGNGVDMSALKELMDLQERWERKEAKKSFLDALSKFQTMIPVLKKGKVAKVSMKTGGQFSYRYADLGSITSQIKKALNECGLSYRWEFSEENALMKVCCIVSHRDGHSETTSMEARKDDSGAKNDIQQKGSTQTYLQRYTLIGALGLSTADEDNDGRSSGQPENKVPELTEEEIINNLEKSVIEVKNRVLLTSLFLKNRKLVEGNPALQTSFKNKEAELKEQERVNGNKATSQKVEMP